MKKFCDLKIGDRFPTTKGGECTVVGIESSRKVSVAFKEKPEYIITTKFITLKRGNILNPYFVRYSGFGYLGVGKFITTKKSKPTLTYTHYKFLIYRVYGENRDTENPYYVGCTISEEWADYQNFSGWLTNHESYGLGYELDKDLLVKGNKHYSPETCTMLPQEINKAIKGSKENSSGFTGVRKRKNTKGYQVRVAEYGKRKNVGEFYSLEEASAAYVIAKEAYIKELADKWKGKIEDRAYQALLAWKVYPETNEE